MINQFFERPWTLEKLQSMPLGPYINGYSELLLNSGYATATIKHHISIVGHLNKWMKKNKMELARLTLHEATRFLQIRKKRIRSVVGAGDRVALNLLLNHLQVMQVIPSSTQVELSELERVKYDFTDYLIQERALSIGTVKNHVQYVHRFLMAQYGTSTYVFNSISVTDISGFVLHFASTHKRSTSKSMTGALRSFFQYLRLSGKIEVDLSASVPTVANWRLADIPKYIEAKDVKLLLKQCDRRTDKGNRDYAILLLLARLGLRAGEVVSLTLDDINWAAGEITIHGKGSRQSRFPLTDDVGRALAIYFKKNRVSCSSRRAFITTRAPYRGFANSVVISSLVSRYFIRAGLNPPCKGAHVLRHTAATQILNKGATLPQVGEFLRHQNINTTAIYAKVDLSRLQMVAPSWPTPAGNGGQQ